MSSRFYALVLAGVASWAAFDLQASAQVDQKVHKKCLSAADYKGCVQVMMGGADAAPVQQGSMAKLKEAMRLLPDRLGNTNLRDFTSNTQIFSDAVTMASDGDAKTEYEKEFLAEARAIKGMVEALEAYWSARIYRGTYYGEYGYKSYYCHVLRPGLDNFNSWAGSKYVVPYNGTEKNTFLLGKMEACYPQEAEMSSSIVRRVKEALVDPEVRKAEIAKKRREAELARMAPWDRHLEENPQLKQWVKANPAQAQKAREKFLADLEKNSVKRQDYSDFFHPK